MKYIRLEVCYGYGRYEGVVLPVMHDADAERISGALEDLFTFFVEQNVEITWPATGHKDFVSVIVEESDGCKDEIWDRMQYEKLHKRFKDQPLYSETPLTYIQKCEKDDYEELNF